MPAASLVNGKSGALWIQNTKEDENRVFFPFVIKEI